MHSLLLRTTIVGVLCLAAGHAQSQTFRPVTDPDLVVQGFGFTVRPPGGNGWHVAVDSRSSTVAFGKKDPEHIRQRGSVFLAVSLVKARTDIATPDALRAELEQAVRASSSRYKLTGLDLEPYADAAMQTDCVRINAVSEERNNPNRPDETLLMTLGGKACRHPLSPSYYVQATLSERRPIQGRPLVDDQLKAETDRAIDGVTFNPTR